MIKILLSELTPNILGLFLCLLGAMTTYNNANFATGLCGIGSILFIYLGVVNGTYEKIILLLREKMRNLRNKK